MVWPRNKVSAAPPNGSFCLHSLSSHQEVIKLHIIRLSTIPGLGNPHVHRGYAWNDGGSSIASILGKTTPSVNCTVTSGVKFDTIPSVDAPKGYERTF